MSLATLSISLRVELKFECIVVAKFSKALQTSFRINDYFKMNKLLYAKLLLVLRY